MRVVLLLLLFLAGCSITPPRSVSPDTVFDLSGRIAVKYGKEGFYGNLRWIHRKNSDEVWLLSPIGQTVAHIVTNPGRAILTSQDSKTYEAKDVEGLTEKVLGWRLPLEGLDSWVRGEAAKGSPARASYEGKTLKELVQAGWDVRFERRFENGKPRQLELSREDIKIKFVIDGEP